VITRRAVLAGAGGLVLARPAASALAADTVAAALAKLLVLEQQAALGYRLGGGSLARIGAQEHEHALAVAALLGGLARPQPAAPTSRSELRGAAARVASGGAEAAIVLERGMLDEYAKAIRVLKEPEMRRTAATIMASHGQHLSVVYESSGRDPTDSGR
jgi:Ferritin-like domain